MATGCLFFLHEKHIGSPFLSLPCLSLQNNTFHTAVILCWVIQEEVDRKLCCTDGSVVRSPLQEADRIFLTDALFMYLKNTF